jgi:hypothetical protein
VLLLTGCRGRQSTLSPHPLHHQDHTVWVRDFQESRQQPVLPQESLLLTAPWGWT